MSLEKVVVEKVVVEKKRAKKTEKTVTNPITQVLEENVVLHDSESLAVPKIPKKRGRKPKGGKIVKQTIKNALIMHPCLNDVHLFCFLIY